MHRRTLIITSSIGAAALAAALTVSPALGQSGGTTLRFHELNKGSHFSFVDNPPHTKIVRGGPRRISMGDELVISNPLARGGHRIGRLSAVCTATATSRKFNGAHFFCEGTFVLPNGSLFAEVATIPAGKVTNGAIVGGIGAYAGARGTFRSVSTKKGANDVVTLLP